MRDKLEEKIREEIQKRVMEEEEFLSEAYRHANKGATRIEALGIITSLPREDVNRIAKTVRDKFEKKHSRYKWILFSLTALCLGGILFFGINWFIQPSVTPDNPIVVSQPGDQPPETAPLPADDKTGSFEEPFDNARRGWFVGEEFIYKGAIQGGSYVFEGGSDLQCYGDRIPVKFPDRYILEITSTWKSGKHDLYGFSVSENSKDGFVFSLRGDGEAVYARLFNGKPEFDPPWVSKANAGDGVVSNVQRLEVSNGLFRYSVNDDLLKDGTLGGLHISDIAIHCCGKQKVEFNHLKLTAIQGTDPGKVILDESFDNTQNGWNPETIFSKRCYFEDGMYMFSTNKESECNISSIPAAINIPCNIRLESIWKRGEQSQYGLRLAENDENYFSYQLQSDGNARLVRVSDGNLKHLSGWKKAGQPGSVKNIQVVKLRENMIEYYVNDALVETWELQQPFHINTIGVQVCGKQVVAFDHLSVKSMN